jgi:hypothetical protein
MAGRERLELEAAGVLSPFGQRVIVAAAPAGAWVVVPDVAGATVRRSSATNSLCQAQPLPKMRCAPITQVNGTNELMTQIHDV